MQVTYCLSCTVALLAATACLHAQPKVQEVFAEKSLDPALWEPSFKEGDATLTSTEGKLTYTVPNEDEKTFRYLYLRSERFYFGKDWTVEVDVTNDILPLRTGQLGSIGMEIYDAKNLARRLSLAMSVTRIAGAFSRVAYTQVVADGETLASAFSDPLPETARLQLRWDSKQKVLSAAYKNPEIDGEGDPWQIVATYGIDGGEGELTDVVWRLGRRGQFLVYLYGYTEDIAVNAGEMTLDNFTAAVE